MSQSKKASQNPSNQPQTFESSALYHQWYQRVASGEPNDLLVVITADPRYTGVSGTGKTSLGGGLAKYYFDHSEAGFDAETQYTLDASRLAYELYEETDELSCLVYDEAQGTPATTGINSKRSQKNEALDAINSIASGRSDRKTVIIIAQDLKFVTKDLFTYIDAWLLIRDELNYVASHYRVAPDVFDFGSRKTKTPGVEQVTWEALARDDPDYKVMERKKDAAKSGKREYSTGGSEPEPTIPKAVRDAKIKSLYESGVTQSTLAEAFELQQGTVSKIVNNNA